MKERLNIAVVSFDPEWEKTEANLLRLDDVIEGIGRSDGIPSPDIFLLPEAFSSGISAVVAEPVENSPSLEWMKRTASRRDCAVAGTVPVLDGGLRYNRFFFVEPSGKISSYDKRHLYFGMEEENFTRGESRTTVQWEGWRIMLNVCFDMRFPCWCRNTPEAPYDLFLNAANWPSSRRMAADVLARARAIENVAYVAFCNRAGRDPMLEYDGQSRIVNHRGREKSSVCSICGVAVHHAVLDMAELQRFREAFPILEMMDSNIRF